MYAILNAEAGAAFDDMIRAGKVNDLAGKGSNDRANQLRISRFMVTGRLHDEATVLAVAAAYGRSRGRIDDRPRLTPATSAGNGARAQTHQ